MNTYLQSMIVHKIILTRGVPGSGKSTWAKQWVLKNPTQRVRWNNDDIRRMLGKYWVPEREELIASIKSAFLEKAMSSGYDIVIDNMNLNPKEEAYFVILVETFNDQHPDFKYELSFKNFFDISLEECIRRDSCRVGTERLGKNTITEIYNRYKERIDELKRTR